MIWTERHRANNWSMPTTFLCFEQTHLRYYFYWLIVYNIQIVIKAVHSET